MQVRTAPAADGIGSEASAGTAGQVQVRMTPATRGSSSASIASTDGTSPFATGIEHSLGLEAMGSPKSRPLRDMVALIQNDILRKVPPQKRETASSREPRKSHKKKKTGEKTEDITVSKTQGEKSVAITMRRNGVKKATEIPKNKAKGKASEKQPPMPSLGPGPPIGYLGCRIYSSRTTWRVRLQLHCRHDKTFYHSEDPKATWRRILDYCQKNHGKAPY